VKTVLFQLVGPGWTNLITWQKVMAQVVYIYFIQQKTCITQP